MKTILDLGNIPLVNNLKTSAQESLSAARYPLRAVMDDAKVVRLDTDVPPAEMFGDYLYKSGVSEPYRQHCNRMWYDVQHYIYGATPYQKPQNTPLVVDIGGNDGTLLKSFKSQHNQDMLGEIELLNVDPSDFADENLKDGIGYIQNFWGENIDLPRKANLIVSTNVFQHNPDVHSFLAGIQKHLHGVWVLEFPYFLRTAQTNQFDQFYHEHYYYWLVTPLIELFKQYGLSIISISENSMHGGTLRVISTNLHDSSDAKMLEKYVSMESRFDFSKWSTTIQQKILQDKIFLSKLSLNGSIACFGAAAKGCVYLNAMGEDITNHLMYIVDDTRGKQGKYVPGTNLRVVGRNTLHETEPDYLLILAHNFKDHIMKSLRPQYKGKFIVMIPEIEIYD